MNEINEITEKKIIDNLNSVESSDDESLDFFHMNQNKKKEEKKELLNQKRKNSNESKNKDKESSSLNDKSESIQNEEKKEKKKKKEKYYNFKSVKPKQICQFYINGACKKGDKCPYSHDAEQIHKKELCKFFLSGKCTKGEKCLYSHDLSEIPCRFYQGLGFCENFQNCPFSHERLDQEGIKEFIISNEDFLKETKNKYGRTNLDEFYDAYIKEKEGDEQYIMLPEFIKQEDKEKERENKEMKDKIPLGFFVMCNNNKVLNELKNLYNNPQMNFNTIMNNFQNINRNDSFNPINDNINHVTKLINDIKNAKYNHNNHISYNEKTNNLNVDNKDKNREKEELLFNIDKNKNKIIPDKKIEEKQELKPEFNLFKENKDTFEKNKNNKNINKKEEMKNKNNIGEEKDKQKEKKNIINPIEINPFLNPMLISSNTINKLF